MHYLLNYMVQRASRFSLADHSLGALALVSLGMVLGLTFTRFFRAIRALVGMCFVFSTLYLIYRVFFTRDESLYV